jgi:uncharacterized protein YndB with AHSA1/START domain
MEVSMQIERETTIAAPVERVWAVLTEAEHVGRWFSDAGAEIDLRPGGAIVLRWAEMGTGRARIVDVEPPRRFSYRWAPIQEHWGEEPDDRNSTLVEFTLASEGYGTRLRGVESGFEALEGTDEQRRRSVEMNTEGWESQLGNVRDYITRVAA